MGCVALGLLLAAEFTLVLWLRGLSISEYLASRDPVSGTVYYVYKLSLEGWLLMVTHPLFLLIMHIFLRNRGVLVLSWIVE